jgi:D-glycero-D-manno-heptose 1,7-bisphosphate phosphatase
MTRQFVLLDRDGTVNRECEYLSHPDQVELLPGAAEGMRRLRGLGLGLVIVTNQSGVGRGYFSASTLDQIHSRLGELLGRVGVEVDAIYSCPHTPQDNCGCRKPRPGLAVNAARNLGFELQHAFVIGDKPCDIHLGRSIGACTLLVRTGYGSQFAADRSVGADYIVNDLTEAAEVIRRLRRPSVAVPKPHFPNSPVSRARRTSNEPAD